MNTSILKDAKYKSIVDDTIKELEDLEWNDEIEKWETFLLTIKSKSIYYSRVKNKIRKSLKNVLLNQIFEYEKNPYNIENKDTVAQYNYSKRKFAEIEESEIEGYKRRVKYLANFEKGEPDIAVYTKIEEKKIAEGVIGQIAETKNGKIYTDNENIMKISTKFYEHLYTPSKVNTKTQEKLLRNIKKKISKEEREKLDAPITINEVKTSVFQMQSGKSPGLDGIPVEFYQVFWEEIKDLYMAFLNRVKRDAFSKNKNTSVIKLIYKNTGEIFLLVNYRPISLINVDVKILTKILANRLKYVLPSIIHVSQTAVYGRKIDQTIHLIRDLIDLANKNDEQAAFIFLDQEKAFDRVNHDFLFKTLRAFGIGEGFVDWIRKVYGNATSVLNVNGFLSKQIPLNRGVRQGCPLSALLYVMVIEVLAIQLRLNPNIVGFTIGGEKIVSAHYMDDATIIIKQNRCFKEVIKEISEYEEASGAKVNYDKTKGLWAGTWTNRRVPPMNIKWTSKNVESLGIYFGNDNPALSTFEEVIVNLNKRLNYWKQFKLTEIGKARVIEMFLASKLIYAMKFYPLPPNTQKKLQKDFFSFVNFPRQVVTIAQQEMWKIKSQGGIKLINIQVKSETSKAKWLIEMASDASLQINLDIYCDLIGIQKGNISGRDLIFLEKSYMQHQLKTENKFYKEALSCVAKLQRRKGIQNVQLWDKQHLFYNPLLLNENEDTLKLTNYYETNKIYTLEQLLEEKVKENMGVPFDKVLTNLLTKIKVKTCVRKEDILVTHTGKEINFTQVTQKQLYEEAIMYISRDHHSQAKWVRKLDTTIQWEKVWNAVHNCLSTNKTKNVIWQQVHLNFYTQYSYNKWHHTNENCPLCHNLPNSIYHVILDCHFTNTLWNEIEPILRKLHPASVTLEEKAYGIAHEKITNGILLRNWLTYLLRDFISQAEKEAYHLSNEFTIERAKRKFNELVAQEIHIKAFRYKSEGHTVFFEKVFTHAKVLCEMTENKGVQINNVFQ